MCVMFRVLVFRDAPEIVYTGLGKQIGKARELEKNMEDPSFFNSDVNISIPVEETAEYKQVH